MSADTPDERRSRMRLVVPPLSLVENLNAQRRKLLRIHSIVEDAAAGEDSALVPRRSDGTIDQLKLASVLDGAAELLREVIAVMDDVLAKQKAAEGK